MKGEHVRIERDSLEELLFGSVGARRFTQDSPLLPDVWLRYGRQDLRYEEAVDLLFTPHRQSSAGELAATLIDRVRSGRSLTGWRDRYPEAESPGFAYNQTTVVARLHFEELIRVAMPLSQWWRDHARGRGGAPAPPDFDTEEVRTTVAEALSQMLAQGGEGPGPRAATPVPVLWEPTAEFLWCARLVGAMAAAGEEDDPGSSEARRETFRSIAGDPRRVAHAFCHLLGRTEEPVGRPPLLFLVNVNRVATPTVARSVMAIKADAGRLLFRVRCAGINWAILDSGIDATHPAFQRRPVEGAPPRAPGTARNSTHPDPTGPDPAATASRVVATYDFTRVRHLLNPDVAVADERLDEIERLLPNATDDRRARLEQERAFWARLTGDRRELATAAKRLRQSLQGGQNIDWSSLGPFLQVRQGDGSYIRPGHDHGTHVAGILGADWRPADGIDWLGRSTDELLEGVCPDINLYDMRVLDDRGYGDEFSVMAALQFVRFLNANRDTPLIHGVNLSLAIPHDVANYACGRTPVCLEAERVVASGVLVAAAAGNEGYIQYQTPSGSSEGYRSISITDPGNAQAVLTVGATHRYEPHTYGVSYFSSRGPTGDGRMKPDLVAPGEKIMSTTPNGSEVKDGTSMAAPHVSGAAAMLIARYQELVGNPVRVKDVLCDTATDLGRERYFQGSGMLDVLRALQRL